MEVYYVNETLYIELSNDLDFEEFECIRRRFMRIVDEYGVDRVVIKNPKHLFSNQKYIHQMKKDYLKKTSGDFLVH